MIVIWKHTADWLLRNQRWLLSLAGAAALNLALMGLMSQVEFGGLETQGLRPQPQPVVYVFLPRVPPLPHLGEPDVLPDDLGPSLPPRLRTKAVTQPGLPPEWQGPTQSRAQLNLTANPCAPAEWDRAPAPDCAPPQDWQRAGRDASELLGEAARGLSLDEAAIARGWIKTKPIAADRQSAMAEQTDVSGAALQGLIFKDAPFPPEPGAQAAGP